MTRTSGVWSAVRHVWPTVCAAIFVMATLVGCGGEKREFSSDDWKWKWPQWGKSTSQPTTAPAQPSTKNTGPTPVTQRINSFQVWVFRSVGSDECLERAWSFLDELLPGSVQNWDVITKNGLRCGIGQLADWASVKDQLENCQTTTDRDQPPTMRYIGFLSPTVVRSDEMRDDRILFYRDVHGRMRGKPFGPSRLELVLTSPGRVADGRIRVVLSPRLIRAMNTLVAPKNVGGNARAATDRDSRKHKTVQQELEDISIVVDLGPDEFVILGPSSGKLSDHLLGPQLFLGWKDGQRNNYFVLIRATEEDATREELLRSANKNTKK